MEEACMTMLANFVTTLRNKDLDMKIFGQIFCGGSNKAPGKEDEELWECKSAFLHFQEDDIKVVEARRPVTLREGKVSVTED
nr:hypothetical protein CFP56_50603 [Quercus suber]